MCNYHHNQGIICHLLTEKDVVKLQDSTHTRHHPPFIPEPFYPYPGIPPFPGEPDPNEFRPPGFDDER